MADGHNLEDYDAARESFARDEIFGAADWDAPGRLNIGHEACDRHAEDRGKVALYHVGTDGEATTTTFWELQRESNRVANLLTALVDRGSRVFSYMPRVPEHYAAMLGTPKAGMVWGSVNERFGPDGEWYLSGDLAHRDEDGYFWFEGRGNDVILSSGYRIGPFEVESSSASTRPSRRRPSFPSPTASAGTSSRRSLSSATGTNRAKS